MPVVPPGSAATIGGPLGSSDIFDLMVERLGIGTQVVRKRQSVSNEIGQVVGGYYVFTKRRMSL